MHIIVTLPEWKESRHTTNKEVLIITPVTIEENLDVGRVKSAFIPALWHVLAEPSETGNADIN